MGERVWFVIREGVFKAGGLMALGWFLWESYSAGAWLSLREFVEPLALWVVMGAASGVAQLRQEERHLHPEKRTHGTV